MEEMPQKKKTPKSKTDVGPGTENQLIIMYDRYFSPHMLETTISKKEAEDNIWNEKNADCHKNCIVCK